LKREGGRDDVMIMVLLPLVAEVKNIGECINRCFAI